MIVVFYYIAYWCCSTRLTMVLNLQINQDQEEAVVQNDGVSHLHVALLKNLQSHACTVAKLPKELSLSYYRCSTFLLCI